MSILIGYSKFSVNQIAQNKCSIKLPLNVFKRIGIGSCIDNWSTGSPAEPKSITQSI